MLAIVMHIPVSIWSLHVSDSINPFPNLNHLNTFTVYWRNHKKKLNEFSRKLATTTSKGILKQPNNDSEPRELMGIAEMKYRNGRYSSTYLSEIIRKLK